MTIECRVFSYVDAQKAVESRSTESDHSTGSHSDTPALRPYTENESVQEQETDPMSMSCYVDLSVPSVGDLSPISQLRNDSPLASQPPFVSFRDVYFSYRSRPDQLCLQRLSLDISNHSLTVVAGASGAGKSSMLALMCALYKPLSGELKIDGHVISACSDNDIKELRKRVSGVDNELLMEAHGLIMLYFVCFMARLQWSNNRPSFFPERLHTILAMAW